MTSWPEVVWGAAVLRGLDERARAEIEAAGALRDLPKGEPLYRAGEPADSFFVIAAGACEVRAVRRGERDPSVIRRVRRGEALGEEATLRSGASRSMDAFCIERALVAEVKATVFHRAVARASVAPAASGRGATDVPARLERTLRRAATADLLRTMSFTRDLPDAELEALLDAVEHTHLARGEALFRAGDAATHAYLVADGMLQIQTEDEGRLHVRAYVARGDLTGETEVLEGGARDVSAVASGATWMLGLRADVFLGLAARHPESLARVQNVAEGRRAQQRIFAAGGGTTQHVFKDLYRLDIARSLLVIDQDACVRCGHCAWACANAHDDGIARIVRRGDKVVVADAGMSRSLLLPNSCQHCENPACMVDCPTGAIGRDPRGEVFIREELCIGCGNCAKNCAWDNIEMAPRAKAKRTHLPLLSSRGPEWGTPISETVAVKCDLCRNQAGGPACVRACPVEAIARIDPGDALPAVAAAANRFPGAVGAPTAAPNVFAPRTRAWPWLLGASIVAAALACRGPDDRLASGCVVGALSLLLVFYSALKRSRLRARMRPHFIAHVALGVVALGATVSHAGSRVPSNVSGALQLAFWFASLMGVYMAIAYRVLPRRLARIERGGALPEDLSGRIAELEESVFRELSGRSDGVKAIFARVLEPYRQAPLGAWILLARGARLKAEEARIVARIDRILAPRSSTVSGHPGLGELVRLVVDQRALAAQRLLQIALRVGLPVHVVAAVVVVVLAVIHVCFALGRYL